MSLDLSGNLPIIPNMTEPVEITAETVRRALLDRATAFSTARNFSFSRIGEEAIKDSKFLARVQAGDNFTIKTYQRVIDWIDAKEAEIASAIAPAGAAA